MQFNNTETSGPVRRPLIIGVGGFTSDIGKTTLLCELLRAFPGWEAIKSTRGHYRSCGKDPDTCCVSELLEERAVIKSGREATYAPGKDTGRYWDAGAANVHWVIATDSQLQNGVSEAVGRVETAGVFIEGNSFCQTLVPDFFIMVVHAKRRSIKRTARLALPVVSAFYTSAEDDSEERDINRFISELIDSNFTPPIFGHRNVAGVIDQIDKMLAAKQPTQVLAATS